MTIDFLMGLSVGATIALGASIAFVLFCLRWAKTHRSDSQFFEGDVQ